MKQPLLRSIPIVLLGVAAGAWTQSVPAVRSQETFRSSVDLVTIQASVRDQRGRPIRGLTADDFEVRDDDRLRPVLSIRADVQSPVCLAIVVDMSGSMRIGPKMTMARRAFESILLQLRQGQDEVALFTFDSALHQRRPFTRDLASLTGALWNFEPFGTTSLYDATAEAARRVAERSAARKAVVVLTDGVDTSSALSASQVSGLASSIDVPVYVVATVPSLDQRGILQAVERAPRSDAADLRNLADWTGGRLVFASTFRETAAAASNLVDELRQQYVLAIEADDVRRWHRLHVRVRQASATVRARTGYFGG